MKIQDEKNARGAVIILTALLLAVIWIALIFAEAVAEGGSLAEVLFNFSINLQSLHIPKWNAYSLKTISACLIIYGFLVSLYYEQKGNYRFREEYGSACWGNPKRTSRLFRTKKHDPYIILTENVKVSMNTKALPRLHQINANVLVIGGSGSGKSRSYIMPNILECACSYVICDPKGELYHTLGGVLEQAGYDITVFNLLEMQKSDGYNPLRYVKDEKDIETLVTALVNNTNDKKHSAGEKFWEDSEKNLLKALIAYLYEQAPENEQNFATLMYMLSHMEVREEDENYKSTVDLLFEDLAYTDPDSYALREYKGFRQGAGKTLKSILISLSSRLNGFNLPQLNRIILNDDMDFQSLGERKRAIFMLISDNDSSFNYLVGMLYLQAFHELYSLADTKYHGSLPVPVRFMMDEFSNTPLPSDFEHILSTCRSRNISINIAVQNMAQLKAIFKENSDNVTSNCDSMLYLGTNEASTHEYISKALGKATIDVKSRNTTKGRNGSSTTNYQQTGRELMTPDEVRLLPNDKAILLIRGKRPIIDNKYTLTKHRNYDKIGSEPYEKCTKHYESQDLSFAVASLSEIEEVES